MGLRPTHLLMLFVVIVRLLGRNKISKLMSDVAKGIESFKRCMTDDDAGIVQSSYARAPRQRGSANVDERAGFISLLPLATDRTRMADSNRSLLYYFPANRVQIERRRRILATGRK